MALPKGMPERMQRNASFNAKLLAIKSAKSFVRNYSISGHMSEHVMWHVG